MSQNDVFSMFLAQNMLKTRFRWLGNPKMVDAFLTNSGLVRSSLIKHGANQESMNLFDRYVEDPIYSAYLMVLQPVDEMVMEIEGEQQPTSNKILENLASVYRNFMDLKSSNNKYSSALSKAGLECFKRKVGDWSTVDEGLGPFNAGLVFTAAYLDPFIRVRLESICNAVPRLSYEEIRNTVKMMAALYCDSASPPPASSSSRRSRFEPSASSMGTLEGEMRAYESFISAEENPLEFWKKYEKNFPQLAVLARIVFGVCGSSAPSERALKDLREIFQDFARNRLHPITTATLIHLRQLYKKDIA
jgi:hypothetical protein